MVFHIYFITTLIIGLVSYLLNWNSLTNIDPNCSKEILKISNKVLFTSSIVIIVLSFASIFKVEDDIIFYPLIFILMSLLFIVFSIINLVHGKQIKDYPATTTPTPTTPTLIENTKKEYAECVSSIVSVLNLIIGIVLGAFSVYYLKKIIKI